VRAGSTDMTSAGEFEALLAGLDEAKPAAGPPQRDPIRRVTVLGAGPMGQALACEFLAAECEVTLYTTFATERAALAGPGALTVRGQRLIGTYRLSDGPSSEPAITLRSGIDDAVAEADAVLLATPSVAHASAGALLAGRLRADQVLVLVPGRAFGAVEVARSLRRFAAPDLPTIVELAAPPYRAQSSGPGALTIEAVSEQVRAAALPNRKTDEAVQRLSAVLPMLTPARGVLETSFCDLSGVLDVAPSLLRQGAPVMRRIDEERRRVAFAYGVRDLEPAPTEDDRPALESSDPGLHDALCCSLVALVSAAARADIPAPTAAALVAVGSVLRGLDYTGHGRTLSSLGLDRFSPDDIRRALDGGDAALLERALA
jgi:opine dehydrogenase